jgi:hypothetical protein
MIINKLPAAAMAIYPFMLFKNKRVSLDGRVIRHELIHFRQQLELLVLPFYILYLLNYLLNLIIYRDHDKAYRNISFELEAYSNDQDADYLLNRKMFAWFNYLIKR